MPEFLDMLIGVVELVDLEGECGWEAHDELYSVVDVPPLGRVLLDFSLHQ